MLEGQNVQGLQSAEGGGEVRRGGGRVGSFVIRISFELLREVGVNRILLSP